MRRVQGNFLFPLLLWPVALLVFFCLAESAHAEKSLTLSTGSAYINKDQTAEITVNINTEGERINAIGFGIDFSTETLEGLQLNHSGSIVPLCAVQSFTRIDCANTQGGYVGADGLVTTLRFKGRTEGATAVTLKDIWIMFNGQTIEGFTSNSLSINVLTSGAEDVDPVQPEVETITLYPPTLQETVAPSNTNPTSQSDVSTGNSTSFGSIAQVNGRKGSDPEEPLQKAEAILNNATVKGIFGANSILWSSILPTSILLAIIIILGLKLYLNEKKRHLAIERIMNKQLGALAVLENKLDIVEQRGADGKAQYLQDIKEVKNELTMENEQKKV